MRVSINPSGAVQTQAAMEDEYDLHALLPLDTTISPRSLKRRGQIQTLLPQNDGHAQIGAITRSVLETSGPWTQTIN